MGIIRKLQAIEEGVIAFLILFLAFITFLETVFRYTISFTFMWFNEFANYTLIFMTFLGASLGVKYGTHFSMEALTESLPDRTGHLLKLLAYIVSSFICSVFVYYGLTHVIHLKKFGVKSSAMQIPMFLPYFSIPVFSAIMALRFFFLSVSHFISFLRKEPLKKLTRES
ncbi:MAG: TRAP transporter small permease [Desulfobacterota bacterium]|nr:TRAP transporter small permease [Thermodesulfobacteriota bacterium]MDW8002635.1 TRAP transporter small permease [Deltaproteobacteria bacterium]